MPVKDISPLIWRFTNKWSNNSTWSFWLLALMRNCYTHLINRNNHWFMYKTFFNPPTWNLQNFYYVNLAWAHNFHMIILSIPKFRILFNITTTSTGLFSHKTCKIVNSWKSHKKDQNQKENRKKTLNLRLKLIFCSLKLQKQRFKKILLTVLNHSVQKGHGVLVYFSFIIPVNVKIV